MARRRLRGFSSVNWSHGWDLQASDGGVTPHAFAMKELPVNLCADLRYCRGGHIGINKSTQIDEPLHRYLHRLIAHSLSDRHEGGVVAPRDLLYMYCILTPATCNVAYTLAWYLTSSYRRNQQEYICGRVFVTTCTVVLP
ncbi:hypothetical protein L1987_12892 [Smallanthus sonchifolius]|uniref:Uncharacterized protein n=1 Tax=Smallanthus sonchifolius TaxID=185202 RepID=A0ACB9JH41_9ASTR|nr:hypothetical protein L1987_12892 [Smallanthus sonchifolius]